MRERLRIINLICESISPIISLIPLQECAFSCALCITIGLNCSITKSLKRESNIKQGKKLRVNQLRAELSFLNKHTVFLHIPTAVMFICEKCRKYFTETNPCLNSTHTQILPKILPLSSVRSDLEITQNYESTSTALHYDLQKACHKPLAI